MAKTVEPMLERVGYAPKRDVITLHLSTGALVEGIVPVSRSRS